jgi:hypothetical protein
VCNKSKRAMTNPLMCYMSYTKGFELNSFYKLAFCFRDKIERTPACRD